MSNDERKRLEQAAAVARERFKKMSPEQRIQQLKEFGILDADGEFADCYRADETGRSTAVHFE